jgi:dipeptidyl aminopeptidase/acylaminoacyl peptidase
MTERAAMAARRPQRGIVTATRDGGPVRLWAWDTPTGALRPLLDDKLGVSDGWIDPTGEHVYFVPDVDGTEHGHLKRVPYEGGEPEDLTPDLAPFTMRGMGFSADGATVAFNPINADGFAVYVLDGAGPRLIFRDTYETWGALPSADGALVATWSTARAGGLRRHTLLVFDTRTAELVAELAEPGEAGVIGVAFAPTPGDDRLLGRTTASGLARPVVWNPRTGERVDAAMTDVAGDVAPSAWEPSGAAVLACAVAGAQRLYRVDAATGAHRALDHPPGRYFNELIGGAGYVPDGSIVAVRDSSAAPPDVIELDGPTGRLSRVLLAGDGPPAAAWRSVVFPSADGTPIQTWVATPPGAGPFPLILEAHGGPHLNAGELYMPTTAAWIDRGYAWMGPNFRGSTGYGREFMEAIWGDLGRLELEDLTAARDWAVVEGIARPDEVVMFGASYGGFMTLTAAGRRPDLWVAAIAVAAFGDLAAAHAECSDALRGALTGWMRGTPAQRPEAYERCSPITYAADVRCPLYAIQLTNDTRTPPQQFRRYENRMRELGKRIEVDWVDGGHMFGNLQGILTMQERMMEFADGILAEHRAQAG